MTIEGRSILVVEDDPDTRQLLFETLSSEGFDVTAAGDGWLALDAAQHKEFELAVVDMMLPGIDGEAVASALSLMEGVPILLITGNPRPENIARRMGAYAYLRKPFELQALLAAVHTGVSLSSNRRDG
jgi:DNA-binding response OmpR family regulator